MREKKHFLRFIKVYEISYVIEKKQKSVDKCIYCLKKNTIKITNSISFIIPGTVLKYPIFNLKNNN